MNRLVVYRARQPPFAAFRLTDFETGKAGAIRATEAQEDQTMMISVTKPSVFHFNILPADNIAFHLLSTLSPRNEIVIAMLSGAFINKLVFPGSGNFFGRYGLVNYRRLRLLRRAFNLPLWWIPPVSSERHRGQS
jgi:hypothetical protein